MTTLKNVLLLNSVSSGATGLGLIAMPGFIATQFGTTQAIPFIGVGIFLVAFALFVFFVNRQNPINDSLISLVTLLDGLWVIGSLVIICLQLFSLSALGYFLIGAVASWVGLMAYLQYNGLKRHSYSNSASPKE